MRIPLLLFLSGLPFWLVAQLYLPDSFQLRLDQMGADIIRPLESDYRPTTAEETAFFPAEYILYSRREKLEIRYHLVPEAEMGPMAGMPHVFTARLVANAGSNDDDAFTSVHRFLGEDFKTFGADWAKLYTFRPKLSLSDHQNAQLVALYREGVGMLYALLLFDKAPDTLEIRQLAARFLH